MADEEKKVEEKVEVTTKAKEAKKEVPAKFKDLVKEIEGLSVLELSELVKVLENRFGVSAAAPVAVAVAAAPAAGDANGTEAAEEKAEYNVVLKDAGAQKINVIKAVREVSGLGLAESKALVDGAPKVVLEKAKKGDADAAKAKLEEAGATVELE